MIAQRGLLGHWLREPETPEIPHIFGQATNVEVLALDDMEQVLSTGEGVIARAPAQFFLRQNLEVLKGDGAISLEMFAEVVDF